MQTFSISSVLRTSFRVWSQNFVAFTLISFLLYTPALVLRLAMPVTDWGLVMMPFGVVLNSLVAAAVTYGVIMELHGTRPSHGECFRRGLAQVGPAIAVSLVSCLAIFGGMLLLVVPGLVALMMLFVVVPVAVTEKPGTMEALRRSRELTHGHKGTLFVITLVTGVIGYGANRVLGETFPPDALPFASLAVEAMSGLLSAVMAAVAYTQLRQLKEGTQLPQLAQAFAVVRKS